MEQESFFTYLKQSLEELFNNCRLQMTSSDDRIINELEFRCRNKRFGNSYVEFQNIIDYCRHKGFEELQKCSLDIQFNDINIISENSDKIANTRISIPINSNNDNFKTYCISDNVDGLKDVSYEVKKRIANVDFKDLSFIRLSASKETVMVPSENLLPNNVKLSEINSFIKSSSTVKFYRLKKRYSFKVVLPNATLLRIDCTAVQENKGTSFKNSKLKDADTVYEIEIEYIGNIDIDNISFLLSNNDLSNILYEIARVYRDDKYLIVNDKLYKNVISSYINIFYRGKDLQDALNDPFKYFIGTDITVIDRSHVTLKSDKTYLVRKKYSVSLKADGQRYLLFIIGGDSNLYLINNKMQVKVIGKLQLQLPNSSYYLFDGELIRTKTFNKPTFMVFDTIYYDKNDTRNSVFDERKKFFEKIEKRFKTEGVDLKEIDYVKLENMESFRHFLDKNTKIIDYETDGYIFTPAGKYPSSMKDKDNLRLKWKPVNMQSIDFKLIFKKNKNKYEIRETTKDTYDEHNNLVERKKIRTIRATLMCLKRKNELEYKYVEFEPHKSIDIGYIDLPVSQNDKPYFNKKIIQDGAIAECIFVENSWKILRIRHDKIHPNGIGTANSNWNLISDPINESDLELGISDNKNEFVIEENVTLIEDMEVSELPVPVKKKFTLKKVNEIKEKEEVLAIKRFSFKKKQKDDIPNVGPLGPLGPSGPSSSLESNNYTIPKGIPKVLEPTSLEGYMLSLIKPDENITDISYETMKEKLIKSNYVKPYVFKQYNTYIKDVFNQLKS